MAQKFLYILNYFVPASHSDGGILNVVAEDDDECFDLVVEWDNETWTQYYGKLRENILNAQTFALAEDVESGIVESFTA
jgi:hypothetical protein